MKVEELVARFPEIPSDLRDEPALQDFAEQLGELLAQARKPGACSSEHDAANHYYLRLIGPLSIYGYGLSTKEKVLSQIDEMVRRHREDPEGFVASLLPARVADHEVKGPGCA